jgi:hypothetical protein
MVWGNAFSIVLRQNEIKDRHRHANVYGVLLMAMFCYDLYHYLLAGKHDVGEVFIAIAFPLFRIFFIKQ